MGISQCSRQLFFHLFDAAVGEGRWCHLVLQKMKQTCLRLNLRAWNSFALSSARAGEDGAARWKTPLPPKPQSSFTGRGAFSEDGVDHFAFFLKKTLTTYIIGKVFLILVVVKREWLGFFPLLECFQLCPSLLLETLSFVPPPWTPAWTRGSHSLGSVLPPGTSLIYFFRINMTLFPVI